MWEWILKEVEKIVKRTGVNNNLKANEDDIVSDVCYGLICDTKTAEEIYRTKNTSLLATIVNHTIYDKNSQLFFDNKMQFSRYQRIVEACKKYDIEPSVENAYKISALMQNEKPSNSDNFTIINVVSLLSCETPLKYGYCRREESLDFCKI